jgi:hypothetical protein
MAKPSGGEALVAEMLAYVPTAVPGAVWLQRDPGSLWPVYTLRYVRTRATDQEVPDVEAAELPIAAAWSVPFAVGIALIVVGMGLALLLPPATHEHLLALVAVIFVLLGLGGLWRSRFTPVEPDRLSIANAVMRARLDALGTDGPEEITQRVAEEREIGDLLLRAALPGRNASPRSWPAGQARDGESPPDPV